MQKIKIGIALLLFFSGSLNAQNSISDSASLFNYIKGKDALVDEIINNPNYRFQMVYTQLSTLATDSIAINTIDVSTNDYFFPASTVKLPIALLTLEKMQRLGIGIDDVIKINDDTHCGNTRFIELSKNNNLSFRTLLEEMIVISDNNYYNSLYHFVTPREINARLNELGYTDTHIYKSFTGCEIQEHLHTNSLDVLSSSGELIYHQGEDVIDIEEMCQYYTYSEKYFLGSKHEAKNKKIVVGAYDFNYNLELPLDEINEMMLRLMMPNSYPNKQQWNLSVELEEFFIDALSKFPKELKNKKYKNQSHYPDNIYKYILYGEETFDTDHVSVYSKIGLSYGFTTDVAYVVNLKEGIRFVLSISLYTNANDIVNDGDYEYETIARPFISKLSNILYRYEIEK